MLKRTIKAKFDVELPENNEWLTNFHSIEFEVCAESEDKLWEKPTFVVKPFVTKSNVILVTKPFINTQRNSQGLLVRAIGASPMRSNARRSWVFAESKAKPTQSGRSKRSSAKELSYD